MGYPREHTGKVEDLLVPLVIYQQKIKTFPFGKVVSVPVQLTANNGFLSEDEALSYLPIFIAEKIKSGDLPKSVLIKKGNSQYLDDSVCQSGYLKVHLSVIDHEPES